MTHYESIAVPRTLTADLVERLAVLASEPEELAEIALAGVGYGSSVVLIAHGIIEDPVESGLRDRVAITDYGRAVMRACAQQVSPEPTAESQLDGSSGPLPADWATMHVGSVARFAGSAPTLAEVREHVGQRLHLYPQYRQRMASPRASLGRLIWTDDTGFRIEQHVREAFVVGEAGEAEFGDLVSQIFSEAFDLGRPLWELWVVDGFADGGFALVSKVHHTLLEGVSGVDLVTTLFDLSGTSSVVEPAPAWTPRSEPSSTQLTVKAVRSSLRSAVKLPGRVARLIKPAASFGHLTSGVGVFGRVLGAGLRGTPDSPWGAAVGPHRQLVTVNASPTEVDAIKAAFAVNTEALVLTATAGALGTWMRRRGLLSDEIEMRAALLTTRRQPDDGPLAARVSQQLVTLPIGEHGPAQRLGEIRKAAAERHDEERHTGSRLAGSWKGDGSSMHAHALRLSISARMYNLLVVNVPPASLGLWLLGRPMTSLHPVVFLPHGHSLAIAAMAYDGGLYFGVLADRDGVADLDGLAQALREEIALLAAEAQSRALPSEPSLRDRGR